MLVLWSGIEQDQEKKDAETKLITKFMSKTNSHYKRNIKSQT